jgi:capsular exopolysaccharide synthesis family protein
MALMFKSEIPHRIDLAGPSLLPLELSSQVNSAPGDDQDLLRHFESVSITPPELGRLVCLTDEESAAAESFRLIAVRLRDMRRNRPLKKLLITSTIPQEGKSMVAANLACTLAQGRQEKVLLLEGDIRRPTVTQTFGLKERAGLCELLRKEVSLSQSIVYLPEAKIWALPAGQVHRNPLDLLQSQKLSPLMAQLVGWFDWIIIDSPPVLPIADTSVWSAQAEGIILVTRYGTTQKKALLRGVKDIDRKKIVGAVLNCSQNLPHSDYYYRPSSPTKRAGR